MNSIITGTGSYIPEVTKLNSEFLQTEFYGEKNEKLLDPNDLIIEKFKGITGIEERRYLDDHLQNSEAATLAAQRAINESKIDPETIDQIIFAHNFGDLKSDQRCRP